MLSVKIVGTEKKGNTLEADSVSSKYYFCPIQHECSHKHQVDPTFSPKLEQFFKRETNVSPHPHSFKGFSVWFFF